MNKQTHHLPVVSRACPVWSHGARRQCITFESILTISLGELPARSCGDANDHCTSRRPAFYGRRGWPADHSGCIARPHWPGVPDDTRGQSAGHSLVAQPFEHLVTPRLVDLPSQGRARMMNSNVSKNSVGTALPEPGPAVTTGPKSAGVDGFRGIHHSRPSYRLFVSHDTSSVR
jgi:hypothetical protein